MRTLGVPVAIIASMCLLGCQKNAGPTANEPAPKPAHAELLGKWKGKIEVPKPSGKDDLGSAMGDAMVGMMGGLMNPDLEIKEGDRFTMTIMGVPVEGSIKFDGNKVTLTPELIMGKTPEEMAKLQKDAGKPVDPDTGKPLTGEVAADGKSISLFDPEKPGSKMVFVRSTEKPKVVGPSTVTEAEVPLVGKYKAEVDESKLKPEEKGMAAAFLGSASLDLEKDNTFAMNLMVEMSGTWKVVGDELILDVKKAMGIEGGDSKNQPPSFKIQGNRLVPIDKKGESTPFTFVKAG